MAYPDPAERKIPRKRYESPEKIKEYRRRIREKHGVRILAEKREFYYRNKDKISKTLKLYRAKNSKVRVAKAIQWAKANPEKRKAIRERYDMKRRAIIYGSEVRPKSIDVFVGGIRLKRKLHCYYCDKIVAGKKAHIDHIIPLSKGGAHSVENLCASCPGCNLSKNASLIEDWMKLGQQILSL